jgi:hypothetical protein
MKLLERVSDPWGRSKAPLGEGVRARVLHNMIGQDAWGRYGLRERAVPAPKTKTGADASATTTAPETVPTHGFTGVGDVLAYRKMWDDYVLGVVQGCFLAACSLRAEAQGLPSFTYTLRGAASPSTIAVYPRAATGTSDPSVLATLASTYDSDGNWLLDRWNMDRDQADWKIVYYAGNILQDEQKTVEYAGQRAASLRAVFSSLPLPAPPEKSLQRDVIAHLEAGQYIASGVLQMFVGAAGAELKSAGAVVDVLAEASKKAVNLIDWVPYLIVGGGVGIMVLVIWLSTRIKSVPTPLGAVALKDPEMKPEVVTVPIQPAVEYDAREDGLVVDPARNAPPEIEDELAMIDEGV